MTFIRLGREVAERLPPEGTDTTVIRLAGLTAGYGGATVLEPLTLTLNGGEVMALAGHNGAGKSTLLKAMMGLTPWSKGDIFWNDSPMATLSTAQRARRGLGYVPEERRIFGPLTVYENLTVAARRPSPSTLMAWEVSRVFELFPPLKPLIHRVAGRLSGGEQQMLAIGRALMTQPAYLLLDEPLQGLAPRLVTAVIEAIHELKAAGLGILLVEHHDTFLAQVADRAAWMARGQLLEVDGVHELAVHRQRALQNDR